MDLRIRNIFVEKFSSSFEFDEISWRLFGMSRAKSLEQAQNTPTLNALPDSTTYFCSTVSAIYLLSCIMVEIIFKSVYHNTKKRGRLQGHCWRNQVKLKQKYCRWSDVESELKELKEFPSPHNLRWQECQTGEAPLEFQFSGKLRMRLWDCWNGEKGDEVVKGRQVERMLVWTNATSVTLQREGSSMWRLVEWHGMEKLWKAPSQKEWSC